MGGRVLLQDLIQGVAKRANISEQEAGTFVRTVFAVVSDSLADEKIIKIRNLGTFKLIEVGERETVDAETGAVLRVKGYHKVVFTPDNSLKDLINKPFAQFETVFLNDSTDLADMERGAEDAVSEGEEDEELEGQEDEENIASVEHAVSGGQPEADDSESVAGPSVEESSEEMSSVEISSSEGGAEPASASVSARPVEERPVTEEEPVQPVVPEAHVSEFDRNEASADEEHSENKEYASDHIEYQHTDYQRVHDQKVEELNVTTQTVEHQTIEHQSIVHQGRAEGERQSRCMRLSQSGMIGLFLFILLLMAGSYLAGYYRVLCPSCTVLPDQGGVAPARVHTERKDTVAKLQEKAVPAVQNDSLVGKGKEDVKEKATPVQPAVSSSASAQPSQAVAGKPSADSLKRLKDKMAQYPQVKQGAYRIVGVKSVHRLKSGESLLRLAQKVYGSRDFVKYIIVMNGIKDPDLVQIGQEIKLPELVKGGDNL